MVCTEKWGLNPPGSPESPGISCGQLNVYRFLWYCIGNASENVVPHTQETPHLWTVCIGLLVDRLHRPAVALSEVTSSFKMSLVPLTLEGSVRLGSTLLTVFPVGAGTRGTATSAIIERLRRGNSHCKGRALIVRISICTHLHAHISGLLVWRLATSTYLYGESVLLGSQPHSCPSA